jgi:transketolase
MRGTFATTIAELGKRDRRVLLMTADLGFMALEPFSNAVPEQFYNVGVAEQNMLGVATGLAEAGYFPYCYSIITFASLRSFEFIRNGPVLHRLPVRIVGVGAGFEYGHAGPTHHGVDDAAALRPQFGLTIISPADFEQTRTALLDTWDAPGPIYFRLGKDDKNSVAGLNGHFRLGRAEVVREGADVLFVTMGACTLDVVSAADVLARDHGLSATIAVVSSFNPSPVDDLRELVERHRRVVSVEAQVVNGGLGSLVAETIAESGANATLVRCGVRSAPDGISGSQQFYNRRNHLDSASIAEMTLKLCQREIV